jgi:putative pyoverdin transport system ATP-binding/permease protein
MINIIKLFRLFIKESPEFGNQFFVYTLLAGLSQTLLLVIINMATPMAIAGKISFQNFMLFITTISLYVISQKYILSHFMKITEEVKERIRIRLAQKIRQSDCYKLEKLDHSEIYSTIVKETAFISQLSPRFMNGIQSSIMILCSLVYIAFLSQIAFWAVLISLILQVCYIHIREKKVSVELAKSKVAEVELLTSLTHVLDGFNEIKMNDRKADSVIANLAEVAAKDKKLKVNAMEIYLSNYVIMLAFFYLLIGVFIYILPNFYGSTNQILFRLTTTMLFLIDPLWNLVVMASMLMHIGTAVDNIYSLENKLDEANDNIEPEEGYESPATFNKIIFKNVKFEYRDKYKQANFKLGPINLTIYKGEILFIIGGNGSGKSTFLKLLTTLYFPNSGVMKLDNLELRTNNTKSYRSLFSIIFSDFHLFDKLYGLDKVQKSKIFELLQQFELENKTTYKEGRFTNLELSTGQKKRLALLITYLEDKPIYVFDEWAADQDPEFRKYFYTVMLKDLKQRGKTVIAVTHDDHYFNMADRIMRMDFGKFINKGIKVVHEAPNSTKSHNIVKMILGKEK